MEDELAKQLVGTYCICFNITYSEISSVVKNIKSINSIQDLNRYMVCCQKCTLCCPDIEKIINFYKKK